MSINTIINPYYVIYSILHFILQHNIVNAFNSVAVFDVCEFLNCYVCISHLF